MHCTWFGVKVSDIYEYDNIVPVMLGSTPTYWVAIIVYREDPLMCLGRKKQDLKKYQIQTCSKFMSWEAKSLKF